MRETTAIEEEILKKLGEMPAFKPFGYRDLHQYMIFRAFSEMLANRLRITTEKLQEVEKKIARLKQPRD